MIAKVFGVLFLIFLIWTFAVPTSKSIAPHPDKVEIVPTAAGNSQLVQKAKYVELKKIGGRNPGPPAHTGTMNVGSIMLYPNGSDAPLPSSALMATSSSQYAAGYSADQVINYAAPTSFWHSKAASEFGEWVRVELKEPAALDHIVIINRPDVADSGVESARMIGVQVSILDADSKPIKSYIVAEKAPSYTFAAH